MPDNPGENLQIPTVFFTLSRELKNPFDLNFPVFYRIVKEKIFILLWMRFQPDINDDGKQVSDLFCIDDHTGSRHGELRVYIIPGSDISTK
jgi:hypothetical protein